MLYFALKFIINQGIILVMLINKPLFLSSILCLAAFSPIQSFALGENISNAAKTISDGASSVGKAVSESSGLDDSAKKIATDSEQALNTLYSTAPLAKELGKKAKSILVYPRILKAGLGVGGHHGQGALIKKGKTVAYYNTVAGSYGLQIGVQSFGYAMFFMNDKALESLNSHDGWEVGVGPSIVVIDEGLAKTTNSTTLTDDVYIFTFNQKGLMAGLGIQGSKITQIHPK